MSYSQRTLFLFSLISCFALAGEPTDKKVDPKAETEAVASTSDNTTLIRERVQVIGSREKATSTPGSAHYIGKVELELMEHTDIHRALRDVPGVNIQEEDGLGLRPNIGIRGTGVERSQKITLMEDGILIAPAPYTAPSAYYFPTFGRMEGLEVLKGSSAIKQGPYTNGGAINMISAQIPNDFAVDLKGSAGSDATANLDARAGGSHGRFGWLVQGFRMETDGFKKLDGGGDTGTEVDDYLLKLRLTSAEEADIYQSLELKAGKTKQFGHETYLGLTQTDFSQNAYRRYAASAEDTIDTDHEQIQLRYFVKPNSRFDFTTTVYNNDFYRNWHKLEKVAGQKASNVLARPENYVAELAILRGEQDSAIDDLAVRNNRRTYYSRGLQSVLNWEFASGATNHALEFGARYHEDEEDRFQNEENYQMLSGRMISTSLGAPASQTNRVSSAQASAYFIQDHITSGNWSITPGVRFESIEYVRNDYSKSDPSRSGGPTRIRENQVDAVLPGVGVNYTFSPEQSMFLGIHRGFSPPGPGQNEDTKSEESTNYEVGFRQNSGVLRAEVIGFFNDYDNLLGTETVAGGGDTSGDVYNGGKVEIKGLEASLSCDLARNATTYSLPLSVTYTYTHTAFQNRFETSFSDWAPLVEAGDHLPYIPENQMTVNLGLVKDRWGLTVSGNYTDEMRTTAGQGAIPQNEGIEERLVMDLSAIVNFTKGYKLFMRVRNLMDKTYIVSRRPYGLRPGLSRTLLLGASARF